MLTLVHKEDICKEEESSEDVFCACRNIRICDALNIEIELVYLCVCWVRFCSLMSGDFIARKYQTRSVNLTLNLWWQSFASYFMSLSSSRLKLPAPAGTCVCSCYERVLLWKRDRKKLDLRTLARIDRTSECIVGISSLLGIVIMLELVSDCLCFVSVRSIPARTAICKVPE